MQILSNPISALNVREWEYRKLGSRNTMVTSNFRPEVEIWPFHTCAKEQLVHCGQGYGVLQNVFLFYWNNWLEILVSRVLRHASKWNRIYLRQTYWRTLITHRKQFSLASFTQFTGHPRKCLCSFVLLADRHCSWAHWAACLLQCCVLSTFVLVLACDGLFCLLIAKRVVEVVCPGKTRSPVKVSGIPSPALPSLRHCLWAYRATKAGGRHPWTPTALVWAFVESVNWRPC